LFRSEQIKNDKDKNKIMNTSTDSKIIIQSEEDKFYNDFSNINENSIFDEKNMVRKEIHQYGTDFEHELYANIDNFEYNAMNVVEN